MTSASDQKNRTFHSYEELERELMPKRAAERSGPADPAKQIAEAVTDAIRAILVPNQP